MRNRDRIELTREEAEILAYAYSKYSNLLTALSLWPERDTFVIYGNRYTVNDDLANAHIYNEEVIE